MANIFGIVFAASVLSVNGISGSGALLRHNARAEESDATTVGGLLESLLRFNVLR